MNSFCENVLMPDSRFKIKSFTASALRYMIEVHPHWHQEVEILFVVKGCAKQQINDHFFTAEAGDIIIITKDQLHSTYTYNGSECEILVIQFDADNLIHDSMDYAEANSVASYSNSIIVDNPIKSSAQVGKLLLECIFDMHKELENKEEGYQHMIKAMIHRMAGILKRTHCFKVIQSDYKIKLKTRQMLEKTFKLIDEAYFEDISLRKAALESNLSVTHFCRLFKKATGMTFNDYLVFHRVNRAEKMLSSSRTITEIAMDCGFGSISSFIRNFKRYKNCTPSDYIKIKQTI